MGEYTIGYCVGFLDNATHKLGRYTRNVQTLKEARQLQKGTNALIFPIKLKDKPTPKVMIIWR